MKYITNQAVRNFIPVEQQELRKILLGINKIDSDGRRFQELQKYGRSKMAEIAFQNLNHQMPMNFSSVDGMTACYLLGCLDTEKIIAQEIGRQELEKIYGSNGETNTGSTNSGTTQPEHG